MASWRGMLKYLKPAFLWRWNVLAFGAGLALGILSGHPSEVWPVVLAAEIGYLGLLSTHPRFRKAIDARSIAKVTPAEQSKAMDQIKAALKPEAWTRFESLRKRCLSLNDLSRQYRGPQALESATILDLQTGSLERLLWLFLKLLYSQDALQRFLRTTDRAELERQIAATQKELESAKAQERSEKLIGSLQDKLDTLGQRRANYDKAQEHFEFLTVEIDRIEQKVSAISEMAISSRDPADVSAQVDGIAEGVSATEDAIRSLDVPPVLEREEAPKLLSQQF